MAPRTKAQQIAYNAKRRAESAAKKAPPAKTVVRVGKGKSKATAKALKAREPKTMIVKAMKEAREKAVGHQRNIPVTGSVKAMKEAHERKVGPKTSLAVLAPQKPQTGMDQGSRPPRNDMHAGGGLMTPDVPRKVAPQPPIVATEGKPPEHTMARSYVRSGGAGRGKLRGKTWQATVSFTDVQMNQVVAAAQFRNVSLAEMIRSCVVEHLNKGIQ